jgi:regulator of replication initiation timing
MVASTQNTVKPISGESYRQFVFRAHQQLMPSMPSFEARNQAVWNAWDSTYGNPVREQAQQYHAKGCPRFVPDVCYFMEHETIGSDGLPVKYSFNELADICDEMNGRCDTHNYSAIADRHTFRGPVPKDFEPVVVGYTGAARLGMVGNQDPKWAVFMDEHHLASGIKTLDQKRRRSVEINRFRDGRRPYIDPIAALGADSPRLPLPVAKYSAADGDPNHIIDQYEAPVMVGAGGTFIPSMGDHKKRVDQYEDQPANPEGDGMNVSPEDASVIVQALMQTPEFQFVRQLMQSQQSQGGLSQPQQQPQTQPQAGPQPSPSAGQSSPSQDPMGGSSMFSQHSPQAQHSPQPQHPQQYSGGDDPQRISEQYAQLAQENATLRDQYQQLVNHNSQIVAEFAELRQATVQLEMKAVDGDRAQRIADLYQQYPHFVNLQEERENCLYSLGSEMSSDQFETHVANLEKYAQRSVPGTKMVPGGNANIDTYSSGDSRELKDRIVERYTQYADKGIFKSSEEILAEIQAEDRGQRV